MKFLIIFSFIINFLYATNCSPYFNPEKFIEVDEPLDNIFSSYNIDDNIKQFNIIKKELYQYRVDEIANEINDDFEGLWGDWIEDGYEMQLTPEQVLVNYNGHFLSMEVFIYGVQGDATKLDKTQIKYQFYNYTEEVNRYIQCKKQEGLVY